MSEFNFFQFMWVKYVPVFDKAATGYDVLTDSSAVELTDDSGALLTDVAPTVTTTRIVRYI